MIQKPKKKTEEKEATKHHLQRKVSTDNDWYV